MVLADDIRTGAKFGEFAEGIYKSANGPLRAEWSFWRSTAPNYRFGRTELLPVRSTEEAIAKYVGKYIAKHIGQRKEEDKGVRLVAYSRGANNSNCKFAWASPGAANFRRKLAFVAVALGYTSENYSRKFRADFGDNWMYQLAVPVFQIRFNTYPTGAQFNSDWPEYAGCPADSSDIKISGSAYDWKARQDAALGIIMDLREQIRSERAKSESRQVRKEPVPVYQAFGNWANTWAAMSCPGD